MSRSLTPTILRFDSLPSTNDEAARQAAAGAPEGLCVVAREQTAGRGRQRRAWLSPRDAGLYVSVVLRPRFEQARWPLVTLAAALAVRDALKEACGLATDIKWPNDLLARGRKVCGILAEVVETKAGRAAVVGIGVNLDERAFPPELRESATSVAAETGSAPDAEEVLRALTRTLAHRYAELQHHDGAATTLRAWASHSSFAEGKRVRVALAAETFEGHTRGLEPDGALRVETDAGDIRIVRAGDVTAVREVLRTED
ncbi:MAG TPA: biotin--[acetyl-CoA-carboxylase] ligase [Pyrinomonadaceae bacterium]|jgi:BirA family biotin operon repressor/biotin-[acetyl-CoA-carboxylase] ligase|nr:biotin--[acetyl-CoA-carboxylase] ligase [Pyrinomonadaceae bacterium]